jgi:hypothetical protein
MNGCKYDFTLHSVLIHRERRNRIDLIANGDRGDILADRIDGAHSFIAKTSGELNRLDVFVFAPHRLGAIQSKGFHSNAHLPWSRFGNVHIFKP